MNFVNKWYIRFPNSYSLIILGPINRFETFTGIVDGDDCLNIIAHLWTSGTYK